MCLIIKKKRNSATKSATPPDSSVAPLASPGSQVPSSSGTTENKATRTDETLTDPMKRKKRSKKVNKTVEEMKKDIEDAQRALGRIPNSTIIDRMVQREKNKENMDKSICESVKSRKGDIAFVLKGVLKELKQKTEKKPEKPEDTQYPEKTTSIQKVEKQLKETSLDDEELVEDEREPLDEENWMRNDEHIYRTCHDNIRELEKGAHACYMQNTTSMENLTRWDRFAPVESMETRDLFTSNILEVYTFISATETMNDKEKARYLSAQKTKNSKWQRVSFREKVLDLMAMRPTEVELKNAVSENSVTINNTLDSSTVLSRRSRMKESRNTVTAPDITTGSKEKDAKTR